ERRLWYDAGRAHPIHRQRLDVLARRRGGGHLESTVNGLASLGVVGINADLSARELRDHLPGLKIVAALGLELIDQRRLLAVVQQRRRQDILRRKRLVARRDAQLEVILRRSAVRLELCALPRDLTRNTFSRD